MIEINNLFENIILLTHNFHKKIRRKVNRELYKNHIPHISFHHIKSNKFFIENNYIDHVKCTNHAIIIHSDYISKVKLIIDHIIEDYTFLYNSEDSYKMGYELKIMKKF